jgi:PIN domain nuclease of toxin-antitoxin system
VILLDTHILVWLALDPSHLSRPAVLAIQNARSNGGLAISDLSLFELAHLIVRGRIQITGSMEPFLHEIETRFSVKYVSARIAAIAAQLSEAYPRDPIDRLIGATSIAEGIPLVTADERIRNSGEVQTIW